MAVKRRAARRGRRRRSSADMETLDSALVKLAQKHKPATIRQLYYQAVVDGLIPKNEAAYRTIFRALRRIAGTRTGSLERHR